MARHTHSPHELHRVAFSQRIQRLRPSSVDSDKLAAQEERNNPPRSRRSRIASELARIGSEPDGVSEMFPEPHRSVFKLQPAGARAGQVKLHRLVTACAKLENRKIVTGPLHVTRHAMFSHSV